MAPRIIALIPAYNEAGSIAATLDSILAQDQPADRVIVIPNGCTDNTAEIARSYPVTVLELPKLQHRKSEALNTAWALYAQDADVVICVDADTILPPHAFADWTWELSADKTLGGSSSKFTMLTAAKAARLWGGPSEPGPLVAISDSADLRLTDTVLGGEINAPRTAGVDSQNLSLGEDGLRKLRTDGHAPLSDHVSRIVGGGPYEEVVDSETVRGVAGMENEHRRGDRPMMMFPDDSVRVTGSGTSTAETDHNVPFVGAASGGVGETPAGRVSDSSGHEPVVDRDRFLHTSKYTSRVGNYLTRLQAFEFSVWTDSSLRKGTTHVLAGTGCAISGAALREVAARDDREGPWCYTSATEDFELTYRIRELGYHCHVSPTVRAYTDSMKDVRSLWNQRLKWQCGTIEDLLEFGLNRLTMRDWAQQAMGLLNAGMKALWLLVLGGFAALGMLQFILFWWLVPFLFIALDVKRALRIPHRDRVDLLIACTFFPNEAFMWLRAAWFVRSWWDVLTSKITKQHTDRWAAQYQAEGV